MGRKKKTYSDELKRKCIGELMDGKSFGEVCSTNNVAPSTLSDWKKSFLDKCINDKEKRQLEKKMEELEDSLQEAKKLLGQRDLEIELLKKGLRF